MRAKVGLLALLTVSLAAADTRIDVPEGCGSAAEWRVELERLTGTPGASTPAPSPEVDLRIARLGASEFELQLSIGETRRVLRDPVCRVLWRSALVIAAAASRPEPESPPPAPVPAPSPGPSVPAVAPPSASEPSQPEPSRAPPSEPPPPAPEPSPTPPATPSSRRPVAPASTRAAPRRAPTARSASTRRPRQVARAAVPPAPAVRPAAREATPAARTDSFRGGAGLGLGISSGVVPGWGPQLEASVQLEQRPWAVALALRHWPERGQTLDGRRVLVSATGARAAALFRVATALDLLGGIELNRLVGEGSGNVRGPGSDVAWQLAPVLGFNMITMDIGYLRLELGGLLRVPLVRPRFEVTGFGTLYRAPALGADAIIRGVLLFW